MPSATIAARRKARRDLKLNNNCVKQTISPERKHLYAKAFLVWLLFTIAGSLSIPDQFVPMFSHCVGFGFFLTITTHRIRWLGVIAIGGIILTTIMYGLMPEEWINITINSAGYIVLGVMVVLVSLWKVVPNDLKEEFILARDGMLDRGSKYFEELRIRYSNMSNIDVIESNSPEDQRASQLLAGVKREHYCRIVVELDAKLIELEKEMENMKLTFKTNTKKLNDKLSIETADRLRADKTIQLKNILIEKLKQQIKQLERNAIPEKLDKVQKKLQKERVKAGELTQIQSKLAHDLEMEKNVRQYIEKQFQKAEEDRTRLRKLLDSKQRNGRLTEQNVSEIKKTLSNEVRLRTDAIKRYQEAELLVKKLEKQLKQLKKDTDSQKQQDTERYENFHDEMINKLNEYEQYQGKNIDHLSSLELDQLQQKIERASQIVIKRRVYMLNIEQQKLLQQNEELQDKMLCRVCLTHEKSILLMPCSHICLCKRCAIQLSECPLCRKRIEERRSIFVC